MFVSDKIESEPGLGVSNPGKALATILPHAPLLPLQRYLTAAQRSNTDHNLQIGTEATINIHVLDEMLAGAVSREERPERA